MSIQLVKKEEEEEQAFDMKYAFKTQSGSEVIGFLTVSLFRAPVIARKLELSLVCMLILI